MNETQQVKSNIPTWISVQEACNLLNVKEKTIKNRCYKGDFIYKIEAKDNIKQIFIRYSSLSISKKIDNGSDNKKYSEAPLWSRIQADKYIDVEQSRKVLAKNDGTTTVRLSKLNGTLKDKNGNPSIYNCSRWKFLLDAPFKISNKCCEIMKKRPFRKFEKETGKKGFIATMASESRLRTNVYLKNGCNSFNSKNPYSMPLGFWTEQDILEYILTYNIPYSSIYGEIKKDKKGKLYTTREQRTGCMFCMFGCHLEKSPNRFERMKDSHPKQYDYCIYQLGCGKVLDFIGVKY